jgi:Domain of unknown function (DUF4296)
MIRILFLFLLAFSLFACSSRSSVPKGILPVPKMQAVMWDMLRADELANYNSVKDSTYRKMDRHTQLYQVIFNVHKISKDEFARSLHYYEDHPEMLSIVLDSLQKKSDTLNKPGNRVPVAP